MTIYPLFKKKIDADTTNQQFRVIFSFDNLSNRDTFINLNRQLKILGKYEFLPSIRVNLKKELIISYENEKLIKQIEEY